LLVAASARLVIPGKAGEYGRVVTLRALSLKRALGLTTVDLLLEMYTGLVCALPPPSSSAGSVRGRGHRRHGRRRRAATGPIGCSASRRGCSRSARLREQRSPVQQVMRQLSRGTLARAIGLTLLLHGIRFVQLAVLIIGLDASPSLLAWLCLR
jgi:hypothetical protein